jgi:uncharacterized membrane protein
MPASRLRQWLPDRRGGVAVIAAMAGGLFCAMAALTVDIGSLALHARQLQGAADLAALSGARDLDHAEAAARATAQANAGAGVAAVVLKGRYVSDRKIAPDQRFTAGLASPADAPNAVRVTLTDHAPLYFGRWILGRDTLQITRSGTAATPGEARALFSIGSRLASLDGGVANQLLSGLTGSTVSLTVMDYNALAGAKVNLLAFADALATDIGIQAGDYDALLKHEVDAGQALRVLGTLAGGQSSSALSRLANAAVGTKLKIGDLIGAEADATDGLAQGLDASVGVMDVAMAMLEIGGGDRQIALTTGAQTGIADLKISLAIGERPNHSPWITVTARGEPIVRTAQTRLYVRVRTSQKLSGLAQVNLPILIELASSEARLDSIACKPSRTVTLGVRPGLAKADIGTIDETKLDDFTTALTPAPATLLSVAGLVSLTGRATIEAADQGFKSTSFSDAEITARTIKTVHTTGLVNGIVVSLLQKLDVTVNIIGLPLGLGGLVSALGTLLAPLGPVLDAVLNPILATLGLRFGEADVTVLGAVCPDGAGRPVLVG